ncbi:LOW QUALITY PROTEIN: serine/threonine-protein kinase Nek2-like [Dendronephthya gigantea]|uniref:LOW QUALITY PROTEIN: serine/threonine-protein kinase Nek2-like n=1 Tax=Dendronephthya gigantea TaxID=151771 RepID=UPI00106B3294|nr:LOW QUALITY PROTEIN: serine/threonine-protein kinase Nek2-like [Dendronephthya gigantea]
MPSTKLDNYEVLETIGSGSYGTCRKVRRRSDNKILVWKELDYGTMSESEKQMLVSEVNLLRELRHPNIVRYHDRIIDRTNTTIYLVMEYCQGGDLSQVISKCKKERRYLESDFIWKLFSQLVSALQECHKRDNGKHILHRDLKPANVFLDSNQNVKLGDFGLARVLSHDTSMAKTFVGTPYYMSPEQMNKSGYNAKSDVWSLGCLLYEACALTPPFLAANQKSLAEKIKIGRFRAIPSHFPESLSHLISTMLRVNDELRPSISELAENPILKKKNIERLTTYPSLTTEVDRREDSLKQREKDLDEREKDLDEREKDLGSKCTMLYYTMTTQDLFINIDIANSTPGREKILKEQEKILEQKLSRTEVLLNELQLERREYKLDLVKNRNYVSNTAYQEYNNENEHYDMNYNRYYQLEKAGFSNKYDANFRKALTRVGLKTTAAVLDTGVRYPRGHIGTEVTRKLAHMR